MALQLTNPFTSGPSAACGGTPEESSFPRLVSLTSFQQPGRPREDPRPVLPPRAPVLPPQLPLQRPHSCSLLPTPLFLPDGRVQEPRPLGVPPLPDGRVQEPRPLGVPPLTTPKHMATDSNIFWLNDRPYWIHDVIGTGGFGHVYKVEMLLPAGFRVHRDVLGNLCTDANGLVYLQAVEVETSSSTGRSPALMAPPTTLLRQGRSNSPLEKNPRSLRQGRSTPEEFAAALDARLRQGRSTPEEFAAAVDAVSRCTLSQQAPATMGFFSDHSSAPVPQWSTPGRSLAVPVPPVRTTTNLPCSAAPSRENQLPPPGTILPPNNHCLVPEPPSTAPAFPSCQPGDPRSALLHDDRFPRPDPVTDLFTVTDRHFLYPSGVFFALKIQVGRNKNQTSSFAKEVEQLMKLTGNDSIVQIRDKGVSACGKNVMILMELAASDLFSFLKSANSLKVEEIVRIWSATVKALDAAHNCDIIHRDIKPQVGGRVLGVRGRGELLCRVICYMGDGGNSLLEINSGEDFWNILKTFCVLY